MIPCFRLLGTPSSPNNNPQKPVSVINNNNINIANSQQPNNTDAIPSILDSNIPNPRGRGGMSGPRFRGGGRGGNGGNFKNVNGVGGGPRQRWEGSQNMPPQVKINLNLLFLRNMSTRLQSIFINLVSFLDSKKYYICA